MFGKKVWFVKFKAQEIGFAEVNFVFKTAQQAVDHVRKTFPDAEIYIVAQVSDNWN